MQTQVNGQPRQGNAYQIEGIDDSQRTGRLQILISPAEAIQAIDVTTSNFEAKLNPNQSPNAQAIKLGAALARSRT